MVTFENTFRQSKISAITFLIFFTSSHLFSQDLLTKQKAIELTLKNNLGIKIAKNKAAVSKNNARFLNSGYLPTLNASAGANASITNSENTFNNGNVTNLEGAFTSGFNANLNLRYKIFDGLGRHYSYRKLIEQKGLTDLQAKETISQSILKLFSAYYEVARLTENVMSLRQTLEVSKKRLERIVNSYNYGEKTSSEVLSAEVDVNNDSISLINTKQSLRNAKRDLNLVMNQDQSIAYQIDTSIAFLSQRQINEIYNRAIENNFSVLQANINTTIVNMDYNTTISAFFPTIEATGSYGWNRNNNNAASFLTNLTSFGFSFGATLTWNLFGSGKAITALENAYISKENQELSQKQTLEQAKRDITNAWETYQNNLFVLSLQEKNEMTNKHNFQRISDSYQLGQTTSIEFRQAQVNLLKSTNAKNRAKYTAKLAELELLHISGKLINITLNQTTQP